MKRWVKRYDVHSLKSTTKITTQFAQESNEYVCDYAMAASDPASYNGTDVAGKYAEGAKPIVMESIARAGVRLAAWLNLIFEGRTGF